MVLGVEAGKSGIVVTTLPPYKLYTAADRIPSYLM